jgi:beta-glucanase (GH16 family)
VAWAGLLAGPAFVLSVAAAQPPAGTGALTWSDDFSGATLDPTRWTYRSPGPRSDGVESPTAVSVGGGLLTIETYTDAAGRNYSGMIGTQQVGAAGFEQTYGYFEARAKFNTAPGQWSAFWLQTPTNGSPLGDPATAGVEMDIAEHRARCVSAPAPTPPETCAPDSDISNRIQEGLIWDGYGADSKSSVKLSDPLPGLGNGSWHTWGLRWTPTDLTFYYDDTPIWTKTDPISRRSEFIVLSSEVGQSFAGATPRGGYGAFQSSTTTMQVDYVRVWALS